MKRHEKDQQLEQLVYYTYDIFEPFSSQITCTTSTRLGGVSEGPLYSLNLSFSVGDEEQAVITNRSRLYKVVNANPETVAHTQMIHGSHVEIVTAAQSPPGAFYRFPETDGLMTNMRQRPLFISVADCAAVAFFDPKCQVIALVHAGWKGIVAKIVQKAIKAMNEVFGCNPSDILVGVSPCLGPCCYQVQQDFVDIFATAFPTQAKDFFFPQADNAIHFDMWSALRWQLEESGIKYVEGPSICTACQVNEFYSHRKEHGKTGRFASIIVLK